MKKHIAKLLRKAADRIDPPIAWTNVTLTPYRGGFYQSIGGEPAPTRGLEPHGPKRLTFLR